MTNLRQVAQQALEALAIADNIALVGTAYTPKSIDLGLRKIRDAATTLRKALEQPEQEPVAVKHMMKWVELLKRQSDYGQHMCIPGLNAGVCFSLGVELEQFINTTPPQRPWVELTASTILNLMPSSIPADHDGALMDFARSIEAKLKERNGY